MTTMVVAITTAGTSTETEQSFQRIGVSQTDAAFAAANAAIFFARRKTAILATPQLDFGAGWSLKKASTSGVEGVD